MASTSASHHAQSIHQCLGDWQMERLMWYSGMEDALLSEFKQECNRDYVIFILKKGGAASRKISLKMRKSYHMFIMQLLKSKNLNAVHDSEHN